MPIRFSSGALPHFRDLAGVQATFSMTWRDVDGDALPDLYVNNHHGEDPAQLFLSGDGGGPPVTFDAGRDSHAAVWADYDGDGAPELLELVGGGSLRAGPEDAEAFSNLLYEFADGALAPREDRLGLAHPLSAGRSATPFDFDLDGDLDVFHGARERPDGAAPATVLLQDETGRYVSAPRALDGKLGNVIGLFPGDFDGDGDADFVSAEHTPFIRQFFPWGDSTAYGVVARFDAVPSSVVVEDLDGDLISDALIFGRGREEQVAALDDRTVRFDVFGPEAPLTIDADAPLRLSLYAGGARFVIGADALPGDPDGIRLSPFNEQAAGRPDILDDTDRPLAGIWRDVEAGVWKLELAGPADAHFRGLVEAERPFATPPEERLEVVSPSQALLLRGTPGRELEAVPFGDGEPVRSAVGADFDNDGDVDVFGLVGRVAENAESVLFENDGRGGFTTIRGGDAAPGGGRGLVQAASLADMDRDGWPDLLIASGEGPPGFSRDGGYEVFLNDGEGAGWLQVDLAATAGEAAAFGSVIRLRSEGGAQMRMFDAGQRLTGQDDPLVHFGLGEDRAVDRLSVIWRDGRVDVAEDLPSGQKVEVWRGAAAAEARHGGEQSDLLFGARGGDLLVGRRGDDHLQGDLGPDRLKGGGGDDDLHGGGGRDVARGGPGDDRLWGGGGPDRLKGGSGADEMRGGRGSDWLKGAAGDDVLGAAKGHDTLRGGPGDDLLRGGLHGDLLRGGAGADRLRGGANHDRLKGGPGDDHQIGGRGRDAISGGSGDDLLRGGGGDDWLEGGAGDDIFRFARGSSGDDRIADWQDGADRLDFRGAATAFGDLDIRQVEGGALIAWSGGSVLLETADTGRIDPDDALF